MKVLAIFCILLLLAACTGAFDPTALAPGSVQNDLTPTQTVLVVETSSLDLMQPKVVDGSGTRMPVQSDLELVFFYSPL